MAPRFFVELALSAGETLALPDGAARHAQVLRLQPGAPITLFNGDGGEWPASVAHMGRNAVTVELGARREVDLELGPAVTVALGMPANERMDGVIEKASELGAAAIQPLVCERSVVRLSGERAQKKEAHWQAVAIAACEQCGRARVPQILPVRSLPEWLATLAPNDAQARWVLSLREARALRDLPTPATLICLSGPEGGLSDAEEGSAAAAGFVPVSLGPRVLRADTAPLALLSHLSLR